MTIFAECSFKHRKIGKIGWCCFFSIRKVNFFFELCKNECEFYFVTKHIQIYYNRLSATYSQFILESQLKKRAGNATVATNSVPLRGHSLLAAVSTPITSRTMNRAQANIIKRGKFIKIVRSLTAKKTTNYIFIQFHPINYRSNNRTID